MKSISVKIEYNQLCGRQIIQGLSKSTLEKVTITIENCKDGSGKFECQIYNHNTKKFDNETHCCDSKMVEDSLNLFYISTEGLIDKDQEIPEIQNKKERNVFDVESENKFVNNVQQKSEITSKEPWMR